MLKLLIFLKFCQVLDLEAMNLNCITSGSSRYQKELLMSGIAYLRQYYNVIQYQHLRKNLTAF